jgi:hypothetical protein
MTISFSRFSRAALLATLVSWPGQAGSESRPAERPSRVAVGAAVRPLSIDVDLRDLPSEPPWQPGDPIKDLPLRPRPRRLRAPALAALPDPLLARGGAPLPAVAGFDTPILNFDAQGFTGVNPPDTNLAVGPQHVIQVVNSNSGTSVQVLDKGGLPVTAPFTLDTLAMGAPPCFAGLGDTVVAYDGLADRWLLSELSNVANALCVYVSKTSNPVSGGWWLYAFATPQFPDYPKYSVWPDAYYVTTNESGPGAYALDRARMLQGQPATYQRFLGVDMPGFFTQAMAASNFDGYDPPPPGAPAVYLRHRDDEVHDPGNNDPTRDFLELWEFHVDWQSPASSTFTGPTRVAVAEFSSELCTTFGRMCFPEPSGLQLDSLREMVLHRLQYRNFGSHETLVANFVVDADGEPDPLPDPANERGGVRWFVLRREGGGPWTLFDEGTHSPDLTNRWMGSAALDGSGNMAVGYTAASPTVFPGVRYTGRLAADPPGTLRAEVTLVDGTANNASTRWGDYAAMSVDPSDDCTFWFTTMYSPAAQWRTRIGSFAFDECVRAYQATFDPVLRAPQCAAAGRACDSGSLLAGRDTIDGGPEPNPPNTLGGSCADGPKGRFHLRESIDRVRVQTMDGTALAEGKTVRVDVALWAFSHAFADTLEVFVAPDATSPAWTRLGSLRAGRAGAQTLSMTYTLPAGALQAVRARLRYLGDPGSCGGGPFDDHDDLVFAVGPAATSSSLRSPRPAPE